MAKKVKMLTAIAGTTWSAKAGDEIELDDRVADRLVQAGAAEAVAKKAGRPRKADVEKAALRTKTEE